MFSHAYTLGKELIFLTSYITTLILFSSVLLVAIMD